MPLSSPAKVQHFPPEARVADRPGPHPGRAGALGGGQAGRSAWCCPQVG